MSDKPGFFDLTQAQIRIGILIFLGVVCFSVLVFRLWYMQCLQGSEYRRKAETQSVRRIRLPAARGRIFSSDRKVIVDNRSSYDVKFHFSEMRSSRRDVMVAQILENAERVAKTIGRDNTLTKKNVLHHMNMFPGIPMTVFSGLTEVERGKLDDLYPPVKGMSITPNAVRSYPHGSMAAHLLGYVAAANPNQADDRAEYFYYVSDLEGKSGLEAAMNEKLCGEAGKDIVIVDSRGFVRDMNDEEKSDYDIVNSDKKKPKNGFDLILTVDFRAQEIAEEVIRGYNASIVVINAATGAVTAMASSPSYNPSDFVPRISYARYHELNTDPRKPFLNRSTMGSYIPGSIIKPIVGLALLENNIDPNQEVLCTGLTHHGYGNGIHCSSRYGHGEMDLWHAIKKSCNVYFVENAVKIGIDPLSKIFASAGIGQKTGIEISERAGTLPRNSRYWSPKETAYVGFGQGKITVTPLQAACFYAALANGGTLWKPYLVERIVLNGEDVHTQNIYDAVPKIRGKLAASKESIESVKRGMYLCVNEKGGSGVAAYSDKTTVYGKTGTADIVSKKEAWKIVWFAGFADNPDTGMPYSIVVMVERGASGGSTAAPIAGRFFKEWIRKKK